jgi:hypothetical protein
MARLEVCELICPHCDQPRYAEGRDEHEAKKNVASRIYTHVCEAHPEKPLPRLKDLYAKAERMRTEEELTAEEREAMRRRQLALPM